MCFRYSSPHYHHIHHHLKSAKNCLPVTQVWGLFAWKCELSLKLFSEGMEAECAFLIRRPERFASEEQTATFTYDTSGRNFNKCFPLVSRYRSFYCHLFLFVYPPLFPSSLPSFQNNFPISFYLRLSVTRC